MLCIYPRLLSTTKMAQTTWQTSMLYSGIVPLIYVNKTICMVICPSTRFKSIIWRPEINYLVSFWILRHSFLFINRLWVTDYITYSWRLGGGYTFAPFWCLCQSFLYLLYILIKLYYTKALSDPALSLALDWILLWRPRILASYHSATTFQ